MKKMNPVVHFEIPVENRKRVTDFYGKAFGWDFNQMGAEMGNYTVVMTSESTKEGPKKKGMINGGFYERTKGKTDQYPSFVIAVDNIQEHIKKIKDAGGKIQDEPMDIPGVGMFVSFIDTEGNRLSILQPKGM
jgi:predicted enzyme related to lactoylglutathione lyase